MSAAEPARPEDAAAVGALFKTAFQDYARRIGKREAGPYDWLTHAVAADQVRVLRGPDGITAASVHVVEEGGLLIDYLAAAQAGTGAGARLLAGLEAEARARGLPKTRLFTLSQLEGLIAFYRRHGYRVTHVGAAPHARDTLERTYLEKPLGA